MQGRCESTARRICCRRRRSRSHKECLGFKWRGEKLRVHVLTHTFCLRRHVRNGGIAKPFYHASAALRPFYLSLAVGC